MDIIIDLSGKIEGLKINADSEVRNMKAEKVLTSLITAINEIAIAYDLCKQEDPDKELKLSDVILKMTAKVETESDILYECCQCNYHVKQSEKIEAKVPELNNLILDCCPNCGYHEFYMADKQRLIADVNQLEK